MKIGCTIEQNRVRAAMGTYLISGRILTDCFLRPGLLFARLLADDVRIPSDVLRCLARTLRTQRHGDLGSGISGEN
jgi:hypothetical protein